MITLFEQCLYFFPWKERQGGGAAHPEIDRRGYPLLNSQDGSYSLEVSETLPEALRLYGAEIEKQLVLVFLIPERGGLPDRAADG